MMKGSTEWEQQVPYPYHIRLNSFKSGISFGFGAKKEYFNFGYFKIRYIMKTLRFC